MTWSYSRVKSFDDCPYQWFLKYMLEEDKISNFYAEYGKLIHTILDLYYKGLIKREEMIQTYCKYFPFSVEGRMPSEKIVTGYFQKGMSYLENMGDLDYNVIETEKEIKFTLGKREFIGYIDFLGEKDGNLVIVDHKSRAMKPRSTRGRYTKGDELIDTMLVQLYLYSTAIKDEYGKYPTQLVFNCFNSQNLIIEDFKEDAYKEAVSWALEEIDKISNEEDFRPLPEYFKCNFLCDMKNECCYNDMYE